MRKAKTLTRRAGEVGGSYDNMWDHGLTEYDTTQLSSLSMLIAYPKGQAFYEISKHMFPVYRTFTLHFSIVWQNPAYQTHQHIKAHLSHFQVFFRLNETRF